MYNYDKKFIRQWFACGIIVIGVFLSSDSLTADQLQIGFLTDKSSFKDIGPHNQAAFKTAKSLGQTTLLLYHQDGSFIDTTGEKHDLNNFQVIWYHQGDAIARNPIYFGQSLMKIRKFVENGGGILLSGGALAMVSQLQLETHIRPQRHELGNWRHPAGMVPVEIKHPAFTDLKKDDTGVIWLSMGGCQAVADFYWGEPAEGMILATTPSGPENPLVEYRLGKGRVIVFGWHWPDYADLNSPHRSNLIQLTSNLLHYLSDKQNWINFRLRSQYPPAVSDEQSGISKQEWRALRMAIEDLSATFPDRYLNGTKYLKHLKTLRAEQHRQSAPDDKINLRIRFDELKNQALLDNPLLDFDRLLMIRRKADRLGLPMNYNGNTDIPTTGYTNSLVTLSPVRPDGKSTCLYKSEHDVFIGDIDLHYDAKRLLMSIPDTKGRWSVAELHLSSGQLSRVPLIDEPDVHNYDACYLPDDRIVFTSTAPFIGVPCVGGSSKVANLYLRDFGNRIRRLTYDQDHNWCPTVLNNGRILYQRWEYTDIAHAFTRLLFHSNPDGSHQMEYYGSNSFWPTAMFFARPIPNHPTKVAAIVGGHHGLPRQGELVIFDPAQGRHEADGVVQRIPGFGEKVKPVILDDLAGSSWPRFLHPYPLSEKYFLVSCKPTHTSLWGIYLVDIFDNFVLLHDEAGWAMLEPIPLRKTQRQPVISNQTDPDQKEATVLLMDVYHGPGLKGVTRGSVKSLRLVSYEFTFHGFGGEPDRVGYDGPWDVKRIIGTVPVEPDGSAHFQVPAYTPISIQPLDSEGKALNIMRSWFTTMPGETISCVGCHEPQNTAPPVHLRPQAFSRLPSKIKAWYGPPRGFSFIREVQPVLNTYCIRCHHGKPLDDEQITFDLTAHPPERIDSSFQMHFTPAYVNLHRFVHIPTLESDAHMLPVRDFHADTSKLIQILRDGHYGISLSPEAWDRLITWIDLNAPAHGTWSEVVGHIPSKAALVEPGSSRRRELHRRYTGIDENPEAVYPAAVLTTDNPEKTVESIIITKDKAERKISSYESTEIQPEKTSMINHRKSPFPLKLMDIAITEDISLKMVLIPPGRFIMGSEDGYDNEQPELQIDVDTPFWMGCYEVTNKQYARFDPAHNSGLETGELYHFGDYERGHLLSRPDQPVVRISWKQAMAFCDWLSNKTGRHFTLPTEIQWEYACRSGTTDSLWYGSLDDDFSKVANLSDATHYTVDYPHVPKAIPPWRPADIRFDDGWRVSAPVGSFDPNPWGLYDMHGNVSEWTSSTYLPYALSTENRQVEKNERKTVRGGSWLDRPRRGRSSFRTHYNSTQAVHDVGFRVICEPEKP